MSNTDGNTSENRNNPDADSLHADFHPPIEDNRPVNLEGKPHEDFEPDDDSLFLTRRRK